MNSTTTKWIITLLLNLFLLSGGALPKKNSGNKQVCQTPGCIDAANLIKSNMNRDGQPCNDFYKLACGGFVENSVIPKNKYSFDHIDDIRQKVLTELKETLAEDVNDSEPRIFGLAKKFYKSCVDESLTTAKSLKALRGYISELGGWPVVEGSAWNESKFDLYESHYKLRKIGYRPRSIFNIFVFNDLLNTTRNFLYVGAPEKEIKTDYFKRGFYNEVVQAYHNYMIDVAVLLGADKDRAYREMKKVLEFERDLNFATPTSTVLQSINLQSLAKLKAVVPSVPWSKFINSMIGPHHHYEDYAMVNVPNKGYVRSLDYRLKSTPRKVLANYLIWKMIVDSTPYLPKEFRDRAFEFRKIRDRRSTPMHQKPRWRQCIDLLTHKENGLMVAVSSMYIRKYFSQTARETVKPIVSSMFDSFKDILEKTEWMDESTKIAAVRKSELMRNIIGYPDELLSDATIDEYAKDLELYPDDVYKNFLNLQRFHYDYELTGLDRLSNESLWTILSDSISVNAYYYSLDNTFVLLAALLQPPLFNPSWPDYAKFASVGFIIGHEIMHAYDSKRHIYDDSGSLNPWLSDSALAAYKDRIKCFIDQYNEFTDQESGKHVDGILTLNENLSDNGGVKVAYRAYENWAKAHGEDPPLPGLEYAPKQLFWLTLMNFLCTKYTPEKRQDALAEDVHTLHDFRAYGMVINSPDFARDFRCPAGSRMNPPDKCELW